MRLKLVSFYPSLLCVGRISFALPKYNQNYGLCWMRKVQTMGKITSKEFSVVYIFLFVSITLVCCLLFFFLLYYFHCFSVQTYGIGTALKILFSSDNWEDIPVLDGKKMFLSRTEIVALFNALNKYVFFYFFNSLLMLLFCSLFMLTFFKTPTVFN